MGAKIGGRLLQKINYYLNAYYVGHVAVGFCNLIQTHTINYRLFNGFPLIIFIRSV